MRTIILVLTFCYTIFSFGFSNTTDPIAGEWKGARIINAEVQLITIYIKKENHRYNAIVDFPMRKKYNIPLDITINGNEFYLNRRNKRGSLIEYKGKINGKKIIGDFYVDNDYMKDNPGVFQLMKSEAKYIKGEKLPDFKLTLNTKKTVTNKTFLHTYFILDFWATWCPPCVAKRPKLELIKEKFGDKIEILSISLDNNLEIVEKFRKEKFPMPWKHVLKSQKFKDSFVNDLLPLGLPYGYLMDNTGTIVAFGNELNSKELEDTMNRFLN